MIQPNTNMIRRIYINQIYYSVYKRTALALVTIIIKNMLVFRIYDSTLDRKNFINILILYGVCNKLKSSRWNKSIINSQHYSTVSNYLT